MSSGQPHQESGSANDGLMVILLLLLVLLALGAGGFFFFMTASKVEHHVIQPLPVDANSPVVRTTTDMAADSPFADDHIKPTPPKATDPSPTLSPISNDQWIEAAQLAVAKKLNLTDNVAWGEAEISKRGDGEITVAGALTADGMSRKFSCKVRAEQVDGKTELRTSDVTAE